jgi:hypothetical protein
VLQVRGENEKNEIFIVYWLKFAQQRFGKPETGTGIL